MRGPSPRSQFLYARADVTAHAILLPGGVMPADLAYGALTDALGEDIEAIAKDLEIYAGHEPPPGYALEHEIDGVLRTAQDAGFERFHLVGYSGGGASSLAFAASHGDRLLSLAVIEPAWMGNEDHSPAGSGRTTAQNGGCRTTPRQPTEAVLKAAGENRETRRSDARRSCGRRRSDRPLRLSQRARLRFPRTALYDRSRARGGSRR